MEKILIYSHVFCGGLVLLLGIVNMLNRKGAISHKRIGRTYVYAMWWICASALLMITFVRFSAFLLVIAVLTFHISFVGLRVLYRRIPGQEKWYDWLVSILTVTFGLGLIVYGISIFFKVQGFHALGLLCVIFGLFAMINGAKDIRFFLRPSIDTAQWWLREHISGMGGSYIAAVTAFCVQNGNAFLPENYAYLGWTLWIIPTIIGSPLISKAIKKNVKQKKLSIG